MFIGVARFVLHVPGVRSLKERRKVIKSFKERVRARYPVSVAEVGDTEKYQLATIGVCVVSADSGFCQDVLGQVRSVASTLPNALLADAAIEVMSFGMGGSGVSGGIEAALGQKTAVDLAAPRISDAGEWDDVTDVDDAPEDEE